MKVVHLTKEEKVMLLDIIKECNSFGNYLHFKKGDSKISSLVSSLEKKNIIKQYAKSNTSEYLYYNII